ncbi:acyl-CoA N-acyltransferase [Auriscalpium vulgare]|uniref:Acyl-CoA N-acyltransferase n=1 Tax=Auriscalpium vulgare TaxID=40419 RepID=A0ACB8SBK0_9AGAM|nr:acyl-CoA N-acyltransferase [Auriscalpium vulgare]
MGDGDVPAHEIVILPSEGEQRAPLRQQCLDVRIEVFHREQGFPLNTEIDAWDSKGATLFLLRLVPSHTPIGTIRGYKVPGSEYYKLGRLAILKEYRQFRLGRELVLALHAWIRADARASGSRGAHVDVVCESQIPVVAFYAKYGYAPEGEEFELDGAPHQKMVARLPLSD